MKLFNILSIVILALCISVASWADSSVDQLLSGFHDAGSRKDTSAMLALLTDDVVFLGLDANPRMQGQDVHQYIRDSLSPDSTWGLQSGERNISLSADGTVAWFDEALTHKQLGSGHGSGVLVRNRGSWQITQYNFSLPTVAATAIAEPTETDPDTNATKAAAEPTTNASPAEPATTTDTATKKRCTRKRHKTNTRANC